MTVNERGRVGKQISWGQQTIYYICVYVFVACIRSSRNVDESRTGMLPPHGAAMSLPTRGPTNLSGDAICHQRLGLG